MRLTILRQAHASYRVVIMGGGSGGCALSNRLSRIIPRGQLAVVEPNKNHYFQAGFTLVGSGMKELSECIKSNGICINKNAEWYQNKVVELKPCSNSLLLDDGKKLKYEFLIVATGLELRFDMIEGLPDAFETPAVNSIYLPMLAQKTNLELNAFSGGNAIFTFPNTPIKCAGAPQKICYMGDEIFRKNGVVDKTRVIYNTALGQIFGVERYANSLMKVVKSKGIELNVRHNLIKVDPLTQTATFELLDEQSCPKAETVDFHYDFLHVGPPCGPVKVVQECKELADDKGWLDVDPKTLISTRFDNVFGVGDIMNTPNAKTVAAVSSQIRTLSTNIPAVLAGKSKRVAYDGYASCPLLVSSKHVILAEFTVNGPLETLSIDQSKPMYIFYLIKRYILPLMYWKLLVKGLWLGPATLRKIFHPIETFQSSIRKSDS